MFRQQPATSHLCGFVLLHRSSAASFGKVLIAVSAENTFNCSYLKNTLAPSLRAAKPRRLAMTESIFERSSSFLPHVEHTR